MSCTNKQPAKFYYHIHQFPSRPLNGYSDRPIRHNHQSKMYNDIRPKQPRNSIQNRHHRWLNHHLNILNLQWPFKNKNKNIVYMSSLPCKYLFIFTSNSDSDSARTRAKRGNALVNIKHTSMGSKGWRWWKRVVLVKTQVVMLKTRLVEVDENTSPGLGYRVSSWEQWQWDHVHPREMPESQALPCSKFGPLHSA